MKTQRNLIWILLLTLLLLSLPFWTANAAAILVTTVDDDIDAGADCAAVTTGSLPGPDGVTSLREAICAANKNGVPDTISFNIPSCPIGGCEISLSSALPNLTDDGTTIDGYSLPGSAEATGSSAAVIGIKLDGSGLLSGHGLVITASNCEIKGLAIGNFPLAGIAIGKIEPEDTAANNIIAGNYIGTNTSGNLANANGASGVYIARGATNNLVGGDQPADRNIISGNGWEGVGIHETGTDNNTVSGNYIGTNYNGTSALPNQLQGVRIYGGAQDNTIGGDTAGERNLISGNSGDGVRIQGVDTSGNVVTSNYLGTDVSGSLAVPNQETGVHINIAPGNRIGGDTPQERNLISGNMGSGVMIQDEDAPGNIVSGNYIGVDATGTSALPNAGDGVYILGAPDSMIGGNTAGARNVISGNGADGIRIYNPPSSGTRVSGNYIGTDQTGTAALPNSANGVSLHTTATDIIIGGDQVEERNVISGNSGHGVYIYGGGGNEIVGNYIGPDASGLAALPNGEVGVMIDRSVSNTVGGDSDPERNFISGNPWGIWIDGAVSAGNWIQGNAIGLAANAQPMGNTHDGVHISSGAHQNTIGVDDSGIGRGNLIAFNGGDGVGVDTPTAIGNVISKNNIFLNDGLGIHLTNGANNEILPPNILSAPSGPGMITGTAVPGSTVELFANQSDDGEGMLFIGSAIAGGVGDFTLEVPYLLYPYLTATATDTTDGTSEFSAVFTAEIPILHEGSYKSVDRETVATGGLLSYTIVFTNTGTAPATASVTDNLSDKLSWADNASASSGSLDWDHENHRLLWNGTVAVGTTVVITFQVRANDDLSIGETIQNTVELNSGAGHIFEEHAPTVRVSEHSLYLPLVIK